MELAFILAPIFLFVLASTALSNRQKERNNRLHLLEQAMANPNLDRATLTALAQQLTGAKPPGERARRGMAVLLAIGWVTLFSGLGVLAMGMILHSGDASSGGILTSLIGFGLVTYPFALRELESRRQPN